MEDRDTAAVEKIAELGRDATAVTIEWVEAPGNRPDLPKAIPVAIRHGDRPEVASLAELFEPYRIRPAEIDGAATAFTLESFVALVGRHKTENSVIFADTDWRSPSLTAVIDYHEVDGTPANCRHAIAYAFPLSEEWRTWISGNNQPMEQVDFAAFIEDRIAELASPTDDERKQWEEVFSTCFADPSELITLSRGLQINIDARVKNIVTLQTGAGQIVFEESHQDAGGKPLKVPGLFMLSVTPFFQGTPMRIPVRLRYRARPGSPVKWFYQIYRPDLYVTERVRADLVKAAERTGLSAYEGKLEA